MGRINLPRFIHLDNGENIETAQVIRTFSNLTFLWTDPDKEPTKHVLKDLNNMKAAFDKTLMPFILFLSENNQGVPFRKDDCILPENTSFSEDADMKILNQISTIAGRHLQDDLPVIAMVNSKGDILYFSSGYKIGSCSQLLKTFNILNTH